MSDRTLADMTPADRRSHRKEPEMTPHIICSINGLPDPDALLMGITDEIHPGIQVMYASDWEADYLIDSTGIFPLAVVATGDQVRAARKALEEA